MINFRHYTVTNLLSNAHLPYGWMRLSLLLLVCACGDGHDHSSHDHDDHNHGSTMPGECVIESPTLSLEHGIEVDFIAPEQGIPLNELFALGVTVRGASSPENLSILVDATMPAHGHGMLTMVNITQQDDSEQFMVEQMNLHMPGEWELSILVIDGEQSSQGRSVMMCSEG
ncbi:MAG: hypothetical protein ACPGQS_14750 [Bradymonadia bacterium]